MEFNLQGTPTPFEIYDAAMELTEIVKGDPVIIDTEISKSMVDALEQ